MANRGCADGVCAGCADVSFLVRGDWWCGFRFWCFVFGLFAFFFFFDTVSGFDGLGQSTRALGAAGTLSRS